MRKESLNNLAHTRHVKTQEEKGNIMSKLPNELV